MSNSHHPTDPTRPNKTVESGRVWVVRIGHATRRDTVYTPLPTPLINRSIDVQAQ